MKVAAIMMYKVSRWTSPNYVNKLCTRQDVQYEMNDNDNAIVLKLARIVSDIMEQNYGTTFL